MSAILIVAAVLYGLAIGSFLNVVVYRVPQKMSVVRPPSSCPGCGTPIAARDNVPVISWLLLHGRCRNCSMRISARYPLVEALAAAVLVAVALRLGWSWSLPAETILMGGLVALAFIDYDHMLLPRVVVYPVGFATAAALVMAAGAQGSWHRLLVAAICAAVELAVLYSINYASPKALGFGDVRLGPFIGLGLGWMGWRYALLGFLAANLIGAVVGIALIAAGRAGRRTPIPYGVFLAVGAFLALMFGGAIHYPPG